MLCRTFHKPSTLHRLKKCGIRCGTEHGDTGREPPRKKRLKGGMQGHGDTGTWGHGDMETRGHGDIGTRGHGDMGTQGHGDTGTWGRRDMGIHGDGDTGIWGHLTIA